MVRDACYAVCLCDRDRSKCLTTLNLHEMQTDKTLEISIHTNIDKNVTFSSTWTHCVILVVIYVCKTCYARYASVRLCVIECK